MNCAMPCAPAGLTAVGSKRLSCQIRRVKNSSGRSLSAAAWASVRQIASTEGAGGSARAGVSCDSAAASTTPAAARCSVDCHLIFLRQPAIGFGAGAAHQHVPLGRAQALGLEEGLDGLLVVHDGERARPIGAPQATLEAPGIEHAGERIPDVV